MEFDLKLFAHYDFRRQQEGLFIDSLFDLKIIFL